MIKASTSKSILVSLVSTSILYAICLLLFTACADEKKLDLSSYNLYKGYIIVSAIVADPHSGPGVVSLFTPKGEFVKTLYDFISPDYASGLAWVAPSELFTMIETREDIEAFNLKTGTSKVIYGDTSVLTSGPIRQIAVTTNDKSIYAAEGSTDTIEKLVLDSNGVYTRAGSPFINTTTGSCTLTNPYGITYLPRTDQIAVTNSSGTTGSISIYNNSNGACVTHVTTAPINSNGPSGIAYHSQSNKLIFTLASNHGIYSMNLDGTGITLIYADSGIISTPRTVAIDADGYLYIGSARDTVEKLYYSGTGSALRFLSSPLIGPRGYSANPTQVIVIP